MRPSRFIGLRTLSSVHAAFGLSRALAPSVGKMPGAMALSRMP